MFTFTFTFYQHSNRYSERVNQLALGVSRADTDQDEIQQDDFQANMH